MYKQLNSGQSMSRRVDLQKCQLLKQDTFNYYYLKIVFILLTVTYCYSLLSVGGIITITTNWPFDGTHNLPRNTPSCFLYCAYDNKHVESWIKFCLSTFEVDLVNLVGGNWNFCHTCEVWGRLCNVYLSYNNFLFHEEASKFTTAQWRWLFIAMHPKAGTPADKTWGGWGRLV